MIYPIYPQPSEVEKSAHEGVRTCVVREIGRDP
jgi:hypothetical protein